jgi:hypothetical protein
MSRSKDWEKRWQLPAWLETLRPRIEAALPPIQRRPR